MEGGYEITNAHPIAEVLDQIHHYQIPWFYLGIQPEAKSANPPATTSLYIVPQVLPTIL